MAIDLPQMTDSQDNKEVTSNDADAKLEASTHDLTSVDVTAGGSFALTDTGAPGGAFNALVIRATGGGGGAATITVPDGSTAGKMYVLDNTSSETVTLQRAGGGSGVAVTTGLTQLLYNDGANIIALAAAV